MPAVNPRENRSSLRSLLCLFISHLKSRGEVGPGGPGIKTELRRKKAGTGRVETVRKKAVPESLKPRAGRGVDELFFISPAIP